MPFSLHKKSCYRQGQGYPGEATQTWVTTLLGLHITVDQQLNPRLPDSGFSFPLYLVLPLHSFSSPKDKVVFVLSGLPSPPPPSPLT